jgi:hypothetical protein
MKPPTALTGELLRTYQALVGDPPARNAAWGDVRALLEALTEVTAQAGGTLTATHNGHVLTLHPALTKDIAESGEVDALRRFLHNLETEPVGAARRDPHLLLVIRGADARLYRCQVIGGVPRLVLPYEAAVPNPEDRAGRNALRAAKAPSSDGFFTPMADELGAAGQIVIFDTGTGGEAAAFVAWLSQHHPELRERILGTVSVREPPSDESGLLLAARKFYATIPAPVLN